MVGTDQRVSFQAPHAQGDAAVQAKITRLRSYLLFCPTSRDHCPNCRTVGGLQQQKEATTCRLNNSIINGCTLTLFHWATLPYLNRPNLTISFSEPNRKLQREGF
jgi:hypothetical protein